MIMEGVCMKFDTHDSTRGAIEELTRNSSSAGMCGATALDLPHRRHDIAFCGVVAQAEPTVESQAGFWFLVFIQYSNGR